MLKKYLSLLGVVLALGACSTTMSEEEPMKDKRVTTGEREPITGTSQKKQQGSDQTRFRSRVEQGQVTPGTQKALEQKVGARIYFGTDKHTLTSEARSTLKKQARWLKRHPRLDVVIEGHTDERGTREYNLALGARRANSARNYLIALGVSADRIETVSYGKERPAVMGSTPDAWAKNRRAVTVVK
jgi:peptidoglycan-associated lipoprotein